MEKIREELIEEFNNLYKDNYYISQKEFLNKYEELKNIDLNEIEIQKIKDYFNELKNRKNENIDLLIENIKQHEEFLALDEDERKEFIRHSVELYYSFMENQQNTQDYVAEKAELNALIPTENQGRALVAINSKLPSDVMLLTRSSMSLTPLEQDIANDFSQNKALIIAQRNEALTEIIDAEIVEDADSQIKSNEAKEKVVNIANNDLSKLTGKYASFDFQKLWNYARNEEEFIYPFSSKETNFNDKKFARNFLTEAMKLDINEIKKMIEIMRAKNEMLLNKKSNLDEYIKVSNELFAEAKKNQALSEGDSIVNDNRVKLDNVSKINKTLQEEIRSDNGYAKENTDSEENKQDEMKSENKQIKRQRQK